MIRLRSVHSIHSDKAGQIQAVHGRIIAAWILGSQAPLVSNNNYYIKYQY